MCANRLLGSAKTGPRMRWTELPLTAGRDISKWYLVSLWKSLLALSSYVLHVQCFCKGTVICFIVTTIDSTDHFATVSNYTWVPDWFLAVIIAVGTTLRCRLAHVVKTVCTVKAHYICCCCCCRMYFSNPCIALTYRCHTILQYWYQLLIIRHNFNSQQTILLQVFSKCYCSLTVPAC